jgi:hypothetical protein
MEPTSIAVDEKEYAQWLAQNNLSDPLPKSPQDDQVPAYVPSEIDPNLLNQGGRDLVTGLVAASPYIAGTIGTGLAAKYVKDMIKAPGVNAAKAVSGPVKPGPMSALASRLPAGAGPAMGAVGALAAPYMMAGYEQDKIRANPSAPGLESNPYAQVMRGETATQGAAGAANRRQAIAGQQYGGITPEQQRMLEQDRIDQQIRREALKRIRPIAPGR